MKTQKYAVIPFSWHELNRFAECTCVETATAEEIGSFLIT
jgi:hypothetical protein